jgi:hypothetical protein
VDPVHLTDRPLAGLGVVAGLDDRGQDQVGVVVALLRRAAELARLVEERRDRRHRERPEQRQLERPRRVPRELEARVQVDDPRVVGDGVEPANLAEIRRVTHERGR